MFDCSTFSTNLSKRSGICDIALILSTNIGISSIRSLNCNLISSFSFSKLSFSSFNNTLNSSDCDMNCLFNSLTLAAVEFFISVNASFKATSASAVSFAISALCLVKNCWISSNTCSRLLSCSNNVVNRWIVSVYPWISFKYLLNVSNLSVHLSNSCKTRTLALAIFITSISCTVLITFACIR